MPVAVLWSSPRPVAMGFLRVATAFDSKGPAWIQKGVQPFFRHTHASRGLEVSFFCPSHGAGPPPHTALTTPRFDGQHMSRQGMHRSKRPRRACMQTVWDRIRPKGLPVLTQHHQGTGLTQIWCVRRSVGSQTQSNEAASASAAQGRLDRPREPRSAKIFTACQARRGARLNQTLPSGRPLAWLCQPPPMLSVLAP